MTSAVKPINRYPNEYPRGSRCPHHGRETVAFPHWSWKTHAASCLACSEEQHEFHEALKRNRVHSKAFWDALTLPEKEKRAALTELQKQVLAEWEAGQHELRGDDATGPGSDL